MKKTIITTLSFCVACNAFAGGYRVALQGQKALGMGHTGVAMWESSEAVFFNPAAMTFLQAPSELTAGITLIDAETRYQNKAVNAAAKTDNPIGTPINFYYSEKHDDKIAFGLGIYTPYGNVVEWPKDWQGSHLVNDIELSAIYIQPTISYKLSDKYSVGFGPVLVVGSVNFNRNLSTSLVDANGDRSNVTIKGSGITAMGLNAGFLAKANDDLTLGVSYRSQVDMSASGEHANFANIPASLQSTFFDTTYSADLVLPAELTLGLSYRLSDKTIFAFDINKTYWGAYKSLDVRFNNGAGTSVNPRNYQDANIFRFGVQHMMDQDLTLRAGIYFDESPIQDGYFAPETPRNDSIGYTGGASYKLSKNMKLDLSLLILVFDEFSGSYDFYDQSGTTISFGGEYKSSVTTLGFGLDYAF